MASLRFLLLGGDPHEADEPLRLLERGDHLVVFVIRDESVGIPGPLRGEDYYLLEGEEPDPTPAYLDRVGAQEAVDTALEEDIVPRAEQMDIRLEVLDIRKQDDYVTIFESIHGHVARRVAATTASGRFYLTTAPLHATCAALMACVLHGIPVTIPDPNRRGTRWGKGGVADLPIIRMQYELTLTPKERETLEVIIGLHDGQPVDFPGPNASRVAKELGVKPPTVSRRIQHLKDMGLLDLHEGPTRREITIEPTPAGRLIFGGRRR